MFKKIIFTSPALGTLAAVAVKNADCDLNTPRNVDIKINSAKVKPSELPLYVPLTENRPRSQNPHKDSATRETIEGAIRTVRTEVQDGYNKVKEQAKVVEDYYDTAVAHTQQTIDYLNEPQNMIPRIGAIAIGGLAGFILAARGNFIRKICYTSIGAGGIAALCYPAEAEVVAREALLEARKGSIIAYNFVRGVKRGDEDEGDDPFASFPTNLDDLKHMFLDLYDEAKAILTTEKKK